MALRVAPGLFRLWLGAVDWRGEHRDVADVPIHTGTGALGCEANSEERQSIAGTSALGGRIAGRPLGH